MKIIKKFVCCLLFQKYNNEARKVIDRKGKSSVKIDLHRLIKKPVLHVLRL